MSSLNWEPLRQIIEQHDTFLVTSHVRPDADALGSEIAMAAILQSFGKSVTIVNATAAPANLQFLNPEGQIHKLGEDIQPGELPQTGVCVIVDTSAWQQLGAMTRIAQLPGYSRVVIDHHVSADNLGATEFKDTRAAATGELIFDAARYLNVKFDRTVAAALYSAIATDTGWFRFPSTSPRTMRTAAELMELGAQPHELYRLLYEQKSIARVRLAGHVLQRIQTECEGKLAWIYAAKEDLQQTNAVPADTESLVNECLTIHGVEAAFIAVQMPSGHIKFSLRCRDPWDVSAVAEKFGGGGHRLAAGATLAAPLQEAIRQVRFAFREMMDCQQSQTAEAPDSADS